MVRNSTGGLAVLASALFGAVVGVPLHGVVAEEKGTATRAAVKAPEPNRPDEPLAEQLSLTKAAEFLDAASVTWTNQKKCGSCHTNYPYLMARPLLKDGDDF